MSKALSGLVIVLGLFCAQLVFSPAHAQSFEDRVAALNERSYSKIIKAINNLAATGDERVVDILQAYIGRDLYSREGDKKIVIAKKSGSSYTLTDPLTGKSIGSVSSDEINKLRLNNRVRRAIRGALGGLMLVNRDPAKRIAAADAVFKSPKKSQIVALRTALQKEKDEGAKAAIIRALAAAQLAHGNQAERVEGVRTLANYTDQDVTARLKSLLLKSSDGKFTEADPAIRKAASDAIGAIERKTFFWNLAGQLFQGLSLGSVLLLAAIGLAITFGVMGVINMAHGELVMIGAYTTFVIQEIIRTSFPHLFDLSLIIAVPAAFLVAGAFGIAIERGIIRFLYGRPLETLLATWGLSLILQQMVRSIFGPTNKEVGNPTWMTGAIELDGGALLTYNRIWIIVFSFVVLALLALVLKKTALGLQMRAVTQNRRMASAMGIRTGWVDAMTFGLGSGIAGMAGVALSQIDNVSPNLGQTYIVDSFMVVVFGGVGNLLGTLFGAMTLGIANKFLEAWSGAVLAKILILIVVILFIQKRPRGMFALKGRAVES